MYAWGYQCGAGEQLIAFFCLLSSTLYTFLYTFAEISPCLKIITKVIFPYQTNTKPNKIECSEKVPNIVALLYEKVLSCSYLVFCSKIRYHSQQIKLTN